jgi:hypothetical protein
MMKKISLAAMILALTSFITYADDTDKKDETAASESTDGKSDDSAAKKKKKDEECDHGDSSAEEAPKTDA